MTDVPTLVPDRFSLQSMSRSSFAFSSTSLSNLQASAFSPQILADFVISVKSKSLPWWTFLNVTRIFDIDSDSGRQVLTGRAPLAS